MYKISVLMPSIRTSLLEGVYQSIEKSFSQAWELVIISPYDQPEDLKYANIKWIKDMGNPIRCRQRGLLACTGEYVCYAADDVLFYPDSLNIAYANATDPKKQSWKYEPYKTIVVGKYLEGSEDNPFMASDEYYRLKAHSLLKAPLKNFPDDYLLVNTGLISLRLMKEIGGFDCQFEACAMACVDLSVRLQNMGCHFILQNEPIFHSTHLPGAEGDHKPIDDAQVTHDQPLFFSLYYGKGQERMKIDINNWERSPERWERRYGKA